MKKGIHPEYFVDAKAKCLCGAEFVISSNQKETALEICSACHPFFTGTSKILDIAGRVEKFNARRKAAEKPKKSK